MTQHLHLTSRRAARAEKARDKPAAHARSPPRFARQVVARAYEYERRATTGPLVFVTRVTSITPAEGGRWRTR